MLDHFPESIFERKHIYSQSEDGEKMKLNALEWSRKMFSSPDSKIYENDFTQVTIHLPINELIDSDLQSLSQKVMRKTWDNKEDEFWDTY